MGKLNLVNEFPTHEAGLFLKHNPHKSTYDSAKSYFDNLMSIGPIDLDNFTEGQKTLDEIIEKDDFWMLQWYPDTPVGFIIVIGSTLEDVLKAAKQGATST